MKYLNCVETTEREQILDKFNIEMKYNELPEKLSEEEAIYIARESCNNYFPSEFNYLCSDKENENISRCLKESLSEHLKLMSYLKRNWHNESDTVSNEIGLKNMAQLINQKSKNAVGVENILGIIESSHVLRTPLRILKSTIQHKFDIEIVEVATKSPKKQTKEKLNIPLLVEPFIYFVTFMENHLLNTYSIDTIFNLFCEVLEAYTIPQKLVGIYLFRREYCMDLERVIDEGLNEHKKLPIDLIRELYNTMYFNPLLVDRFACIEMLNKNLEKWYYTRERFGRYSNNISFLSEPGELDDLPQWLGNLFTTVLKFFLIYIPLMEQCFFDLLERNTLNGEYDFDPERYLANFGNLNDTNVQEYYTVEINNNSLATELIKDFSLVSFTNKYPRNTDKDMIEQFIQLQVEMDEFVEDVKSKFFNR